MDYKKVQSRTSSSNILFKILPIALILFIFGSADAQNLLSGPECVAFDAARNRYLVSCYTNGNIIQIDSNGVQSYLLTGFGHVLSNTIRGNIFYFSTVTSIKGYNISVTPPQQVMNLYITGSKQLDGMVTDTSGNLYVADYDYQGTNDKIFKINLSTQSFSTFVPPGQGLGSPQDIEFDPENNRLIVANWFNGSPIQAVSLSDSTVTNLVQSSIGNFDGIARDTSGNYYFTSWGTNKVHKYDKNFINTPVEIASGFNGPANISYNPKGNLLVVPNFNTNSVIYINLNTIGIKKIEKEIPGGYRLYQNYPNPFNPKTKITFDIFNPGKVRLSIYDIAGKEIKTLINEEISTGKYEISFDATGLSSGVYIYRLESGNFSDTKKMSIIK